MKHHTKVYMRFFGYGEQDFIPSELSGQRANDIHHIHARQRGGSDEKDNIENLMALTRSEHIKYGDKKQYKEWLTEKHFEFIRKHRPDYVIQENKEAFDITTEG